MKNDKLLYINEKMMVLGLFIATCIVYIFMEVGNIPTDDNQMLIILLFVLSFATTIIFINKRSGEKLYFEDFKLEVIIGSIYFFVILTISAFYLYDFANTNF